MPNSFGRTLRALKAQSSWIEPLVLACACAALLLWVLWALTAELPVYAVSERARIEAQRAAFLVAAPVAGRLRRVVVAVGDSVAAGDVLIELEAAIEEQRLREERSRLGAMREQLEHLRSELRGETRGLGAAQRVSRGALEEARARLQAASASTALAEQELRAKERLRAQELVAEVDVLRARAEATQRQAESRERAASLARLDAELAREKADRGARSDQIRREISRVAGEVNGIQAAVARLEEESRWRVIRAPAAGRIAELAAIGAGTFVQPGERLGTLVPEAGLKAVAGFRPAEAGRIRPGQRASMRLEGFPWTEYGTLTARVGSVTSELRDGLLWVDLALTIEPRSQIPLQHALPGSVAVEVDRLSPAALVLRSIGARASRTAEQGPMSE